MANANVNKKAAEVKPTAKAVENTVLITLGPKGHVNKVAFTGDAPAYAAGGRIRNWLSIISYEARVVLAQRRQDRIKAADLKKRKDVPKTDKT